MRDRRRGTRGLGRVLATPLAMGPILLSVLAFADPVERPVGPGLGERVRSLQELEVRAAVLSRGAGMVERFYEDRVAPVERMLAPYHRDEDFVREVALALVREADLVGLAPRALASVLLVENPWLDPGASSFMGAVGLMQVMPFHAGRWDCPSADLRDVGANICHGARIFAAYLRRFGGDLDRALLAYNGCVSGINTPDCHLYPSHVYSLAGRAAMAHWLELH